MSFVCTVVAGLVSTGCGVGDCKAVVELTSDEVDSTAPSVVPAAFGVAEVVHGSVVREVVGDSVVSDAVDVCVVDSELPYVDAVDVRVLLEAEVSRPPEVAGAVQIQLVSVP